MGKPNTRIYTAGINIRHPWAKLILSGRKTVETRSYPLPQKHLGKILAIIETGKPNPSRIVGLVRFSHSFKYQSFHHWHNDYKRHLVSKDDPDFSFSEKKPKWGWEIDFFFPIVPSVKPPKIKGIKFAARCSIPRKILNAKSIKLIKLDSKQ